MLVVKGCGVCARISVALKSILWGAMVRYLFSLHSSSRHQPRAVRFVNVKHCKLPGQLFISGGDPELFASCTVDIEHLTVEAQLYHNRHHRTTKPSSSSSSSMYHHYYNHHSHYQQQHSQYKRCQQSWSTPQSSQPPAYLQPVAWSHSKVTLTLNFKYLLKLSPNLFCSTCSLRDA